eukprot:g17184.t1
MLHARVFRSALVAVLQFLSVFHGVSPVEAALFGLGHGGHRIYWDSERATLDMTYSAAGGGMGATDAIRAYTRSFIDENSATDDRGEVYMYQLRTPTAGGHNCVMIVNWGQTRGAGGGGDYEDLDERAVGVDGHLARVWNSQYPECVVWTENLEFLSDITTILQEQYRHEDGTGAAGGGTGLTAILGQQIKQHNPGVNEARANALLTAGQTAMAGNTELRHMIWIPSYMAGGLGGAAMNFLGGIMGNSVDSNMDRVRQYRHLNMQLDGRVEVDPSQANLIKLDIRFQNICVGLCCGFVVITLLGVCGGVAGIIFCHVRKQKEKFGELQRDLDEDYYEDGYDDETSSFKPSLREQSYREFEGDRGRTGGGGGRTRTRSRSGGRAARAGGRKMRHTQFADANGGNYNVEGEPGATMGPRR